MLKDFADVLNGVGALQI